MAQAWVVAALTATAVITAGCEKKKTHRSYVEVPRSQWGSEYAYRSIALTTMETQSLGRAVAIVERMSGTVGTGFFISDDGLFLTNHHVIPRDICNQSRCQGIRLVRDARPGGSYQVFYDFDVVAQDPIYDFTLLKVNLKTGERVPFLAIKSNLESEDFTRFAKPDGRFLMLGHPSESSLQAAPVVIARVSGSNLVFKGIYIGGNSGGPLVDTLTGEAVAIGHSSSFGEIKGAKGFSIEVNNQATPLIAIVKRLRLLTRGNAEQGPVQILSEISRSYKEIHKSESFDMWIKSNLLPEKAIRLEDTLAKLAVNKEFLTAFDAFFLNSNLEAKALAAAFPDQGGISRDQSELIGTTGKLFLLSITSNQLNRPLRMSEPQYESLISGRQFFIREDVPFEEVKAVELESLRLLASCQLDSELPAVERLVEYFRCPPEATVLRRILAESLQSGRAEGGAVAALSYGMLGRTYLTPAEKQEITQFAALFVGKARNLSVALRLEGLVDRMNENSDLVLKGSWREPLPVNYTAEASLQPNAHK